MENGLAASASCVGETFFCGSSPGLVRVYAQFIEERLRVAEEFAVARMPHDLLDVFPDLLAREVHAAGARAKIVMPALAVQTEDGFDVMRARPVQSLAKFFTEGRPAFLGAFVRFQLIEFVFDDVFEFVRDNGGVQPLRGIAEFGRAAPRVLPLLRSTVIKTAMGNATAQADAQGFHRSNSGGDGTEAFLERAASAHALGRQPREAMFCKE